MSVMILEPAAIGQLVAWAKANDVKVDNIRASAYANMVVQIVETNMAAYDDRYSDVNDLSVDNCVKEAFVAFNRYKNAAPNMIDAAVIYQFAKSINYQCCEADDWGQGNAVYDFLNRVKLKAGDKMMYQILGDAAQDAWAPDSLVGIGKKEAA
jgi:hypothetical protein